MAEEAKPKGLSKELRALRAQVAALEAADNIREVAEGALKDNEERFRQLVEHAADAFLVIERGGMAPNSSVTMFPRRRHSMHAPRPATANCQEIVAGVERRAKCYDRDAGDFQGCWCMLPRRLCGRSRPGRTTATKTALVKGGANRPDVPRSRLRR